MKFLALTALVAALAAAPSTVIAADEFCIAIFGYKPSDKSEIIDKLIAQAKAQWELDQSVEYKMEPTADDDEAFVPLCLVNRLAFSNMGFETNADIFLSTSTQVTKGITAAERTKFTNAVSGKSHVGNPYNDPEFVQFVKGLYHKTFNKNQVEMKFYWSSATELMKQPECTAQNLLKYLNSDDGNPGYETAIFDKVLKFEKLSLNAAQTSKCVTNGKPICTTSTGDAEQDEKVAACVACSKSNGLIASAVGAAALVALGLFF